MSTQHLSSEDSQWLQKTFKLKKERPVRPVASNFCVAAIVTYVSNQEGEKGSVKYVCGANVETTFIGTGCCAERCALMRLSDIAFEKVLAIYLVSDSPTILTPGLLCRDFITHYTKEGRHDIKIVMGSENPSVPAGFEWKQANISELYPFPHNYLGVSGPKTAQFASQFAKKMQPFAKTHATFGALQLDEGKLVDLYRAVVYATRQDGHNYLHPLQYAAGFLMNDNSIVVAHQSKLSEYGYSTDPVSAAITLLIQQHHNADSSGHAPSGNSQYPVALVQTDQFGVCHAPFAPARCHLRETLQNSSSLVIFCHDSAGQLHTTDVQGLCPDFPDVTEGLSKTSDLPSRL